MISTRKSIQTNPISQISATGLLIHFGNRWIALGIVETSQLNSYLAKIVIDTEIHFNKIFIELLLQTIF